MPELPEVETVRRQLSQRLPGRRIVGVTIDDPLCADPCPPAQLAAQLEGREIRSVRRRGKYLTIWLDDGAQLVVHLRMTGRLLWWPPDADVAPERFLRATIDLDDGSTLQFADQRRFGRLLRLDPSADPEAHWRGRVGVEPLSGHFTPAAFAAVLRGRRTPIKAALLNQALVTGIGNIYADEALHQAGIHPETMAGSLSATRVERLRQAIIDVLRIGLATGGASIHTYADALGGRGGMQSQLQVHLNEGRPCPACGTTVVKTRVAQRGTYHCPRCQRRSGRRT